MAKKKAKQKARTNSVTIMIMRIDLGSGLHEGLLVRTGGVIDDIAQGVCLWDDGVADGQKHQEIVNQAR